MKPEIFRELGLMLPAKKFFRRTGNRLVYFDMNEMIAFSREESLQEEIEQMLAAHDMTAPYAPPHMEESRRRLPEEREAFEEFINGFSGQWEMRPCRAEDMCVLMREHPKVCMKRVLEQGGDAVSDECEQEDARQLEEARGDADIMRMKPKVISGIPFDRIFEEMSPEDPHYQQKIRDFLAFCEEHQSEWPQHTFADKKRYDFEEFHAWGFLEAYIELMMKYLQEIPYHQDSLKRAKGSLTHDITHVIYGIFCDYFVTEDKTLRYRLKALYHWMNAPTAVMSLDEFRNRLASEA